MPSVTPVCVSIPGHSPALPHLLGGKEGGGSGGAKNESPGITTPLLVLLLPLIIPPMPPSMFKVRALMSPQNSHPQPPVIDAFPACKAKICSSKLSCWERQKFIILGLVMG